MRNARSRCGFTVIELLAAMLAGAVLALTAGSMLFYAYGSWRRGRDGAAMQQDGRAAMELISRTARDAAATNLDARPSELRVAMPSNRTWRVFAQGGQLVCDPSMAVTGDEHVVAQAGVRAFSVSNDNGRLRVTLRLEAGEGAYRETLDGRYTCRN
jgi:prepilin-type N-terminal cleavage/methylation domain-containing protein